MSTYKVCTLEDVPNYKTKVVACCNVKVVLVRIDDDIYALEDRCTHQDYKLSDGDIDVDELTIECNRHGSQFSLVDGTPKMLPAAKAVRKFDAKVVEGEVFLECS